MCNSAQNPHNFIGFCFCFFNYHAIRHDNVRNELIKKNQKIIKESPSWKIITSFVGIWIIWCVQTCAQMGTRARVWMCVCMNTLLSFSLSLTLPLFLHVPDYFIPLRLWGLFCIRFYAHSNWIWHKNVDMISCGTISMPH